MDVKAMVLIGTQAPPAEAAGGVPIALLDILGRPVLHRVADRLCRYGISGITVIGDGGPGAARLASRVSRAGLHWIPVPGQSPWRAAQRAFSELVHAGAELVLVLRLGPYTEIDYDHLIQFHLDHRGRITSVVDPSGQPLDTFVICASRRNDAAFLFRHRLHALRAPGVVYKFEGYVNPLAGPGDLRSLAVDAFCGRAQIAPEGRQVKPGVWIAPGARVHRGARLLAPAFVGEHAKVRASAVLTRCSVVEHHAQVDCGTVVEDSTLLPYTTVGAGLDLAHSVVAFGRLTHLRRQVEIEVSDPKLVGTVLTAPLRALGSAASLATFFPLQFARLLFGRKRQEPAALPAAAHAPSHALKSDPAVQVAEAPQPNQFPTPFVVARRYGDE